MAVQLKTNETGKAVEITGNSTVENYLSPSPNEFLVVKGMLLGGTGNTGESRIETDKGKILLVLYHSVQSRFSPSGRTNIVLDPGESIRIITVDRVAQDKTFVGVSVERYGVDA